MRIHPLCNYTAKDIVTATLHGFSQIFSSAEGYCSFKHHLQRFFIQTCIHVVHLFISVLQNNAYRATHQRVSVPPHRSLNKIHLICSSPCVTITIHYSIGSCRLQLYRTRSTCWCLSFESSLCKFVTIITQIHRPDQSNLPLAILSINETHIILMFI